MNVHDTIRQFGSAKIELEVPVVDKKNFNGVFSFEALIEVVDLSLQDIGHIEFKDATKLLISLATRNGYFRTMKLSDGNIGIGYIHHGPNFNMDDANEVKALDTAMKRVEESKKQMEELIQNAA